MTTLAPTLTLWDWRRRTAALWQDIRAAGTPEAGWVLASWAHGQGLAREATEAMLAWADRALAAPRIACMIDPHNDASLALAAKLGFRRFADTHYKAKPTVLLERFAPR